MNIRANTITSHRIISRIIPLGEKEITRNYTLSMGWNWFSINVQDQNLNDIPALLAPIKESVLILKGQNGELTNKNENDWEGSLNSLNTTQAYKIKMKKEATLELTGKGADPTGLELDRLYSYRHFTIGASLAKSAS